MNKITLRYLLSGNSEFEIINLSLEDYFDKENEKEFSIESIPKYMQPYEYAPCDVTKLMQLNLKIEMGNDILEFSQVFWNHGQNIFTERIDKGKKNKREVILSSCIDNINRQDEILRLRFLNGNIYPIHHSFIKRSIEGVEEETEIDLSDFRAIYKKG